MHKCFPLLALTSLLLAPAAPADQALVPKLEGRALVDALARGGHVLLMRHTTTDPKAIDRETFDLRDCSTQRTLSEAGRTEARQIGRAIAKLGIPVGQVFSSPYCRCLTTGKLAFGHVSELPLLAVWDGLTVPEKSERGGEVRRLLATAPENGENDVLITHTGTLLYSFGLDSRPEGIVHVFRPGPAGTATYVGRLTPADLVRLAGLEPETQPEQ